MAAILQLSKRTHNDGSYNATDSNHSNSKHDNTSNSNNNNSHKTSNKCAMAKHQERGPVKATSTERGPLDSNVAFQLLVSS
eukprot:3069836-Amphidinium_carterae.1